MSLHTVVGSMVATAFVTVTCTVTCAVCGTTGEHEQFCLPGQQVMAAHVPEKWHALNGHCYCPRHTIRIDTPAVPGQEGETSGGRTSDDSA